MSGRIKDGSKTLAREEGKKKKPRAENNPVYNKYSVKMATTVQSSWRSIGNKLIISMSLNPITCSCNQHLSHPTQDLDMNKKKPLRKT